ncbi:MULTISPECIES: reverse transcriptase domain-containing protein [unclassified Enterobacter]|uniref:reverse transcriptase domain-containing protein n=1 Tax=unclassified Enterobacter TaxID=2608935 RepID=UPI00292B7913|nr:reverse transcriptase domain-containing protein [Enterobacter sp. 23-M-SZ-13]MDV0597381.1 reverse transcriptase domain-containing protein [Enterobacter sp. 23-M-SZ-13]
MSLKYRITIINSERQKKGQPLLPILKNNEPQSSIYNGRTEWANPKHFIKYSLNASDLLLFADAISNRELPIESYSDIAELIEVPTGQFLHIIYNNTSQNYKQFQINKKSGGMRTISSPQRGVKVIQERLKAIFDILYRPKLAAHGFILNRSIQSNAERHVKKKYVVNIDLLDFFDSITFARIFGLLKSPPFNFGIKAASAVAQVCTHKGKLPQGGITSPVLSNLIASSLDKKLTSFAKRNNGQYTRYADDITFSFNSPPSDKIVNETDGLLSIGEELNSIISSCGFTVNQKKFRLQTKKERQEVTGLTINQKVNISKRYIKTTRAMIHGWKKDRQAAAENFLKLHHKAHRTPPDNLVEHFRNHIYGRLSFIKMIRGPEFSTYLKMTAHMASLDAKPTKEGARAMKEIEMFDVFLCHASEDKESIVFPLYKALESKGINAFIDSEYIEWGDSLIGKINNALAKSKFVIAILTKNSVIKHWPATELKSVLAREGANKFLI